MPRHFERHSSAQPTRRAFRDLEVMTMRPSWLGLVALLPALLGAGPCGPFPGDRLDGEVSASVPGDWTFTDALSTIQIETNPAAPYSVTTWCFTDGTTLYVPSRSAARKPWVANVTADPSVRVRVGEGLYAMRIERLTDAGELGRLIPRLRAKYRLARWSMSDDPAAAGDTWFFRLRPAAN